MTSHSPQSGTEVPAHNIPSTGIIILSAGNSSRMGHPKQLLQIENQSLIQLLVVEACKSQAITTLVVTGAYHQEIANELYTSPITIVQNTDWIKGMGSSIRLGLNRLLALQPQLEAVILTVSDQPYLTADHLNRLIGASVSHKKSIVASFYEGEMGTPVFFAKELFSTLLHLDESKGARPLLKKLAHQATSIPFPLGSIDLDRWEDYLNFLAGRQG